MEDTVSPSSTHKFLTTYYIPGSVLDNIDSTGSEARISNPEAVTHPSLCRMQRINKIKWKIMIKPVVGTEWEIRKATLRKVHLKGTHENICS